MNISSMPFNFLQKELQDLVLTNLLMEDLGNVELANNEVSPDCRIEDELIEKACQHVFLDHSFYMRRCLSSGIPARNIVRFSNLQLVCRVISDSTMSSTIPSSIPGEFSEKLKNLEETVKKTVFAAAGLAEGYSIILLLHYLPNLKIININYNCDLEEKKVLEQWKKAGTDRSVTFFKTVGEVLSKEKRYYANTITNEVSKNILKNFPVGSCFFSKSLFDDVAVFHFNSSDSGIGRSLIPMNNSPSFLCNLFNISNLFNNCIQVTDALVKQYAETALNVLAGEVRYYRKVVQNEIAIVILASEPIGTYFICDSLENPDNLTVHFVSSEGIIREEWSRFTPREIFVQQVLRHPNLTRPILVTDERVSEIAKAFSDTLRGSSGST